MMATTDVPAVDIYALGEGDVLATEIIRRWLDADGDRERMFAPHHAVARLDGL